jgi:hypothetical protein
MVREIELCSAKPKPCSLPPLSFLSWPCSWKILIYFNSLFCMLCTYNPLANCQFAMTSSFLFSESLVCLDIILEFMIQWEMFLTSSSLRAENCPAQIQLHPESSSRLAAAVPGIEFQSTMAPWFCDSQRRRRLHEWRLMSTDALMCYRVQALPIVGAQSLRCGAYADQPGRCSIWRTASGWDPSGYPPRSTERLCFMRWHATI